jgi:pseudouridine kinase
MTEEGNNRILVIGSAGVDIIARASVTIQSGTSSPGVVRMSYGGVARNVAENLARLGLDVVLITAVGDDSPGRRLLENAAQAGINTDHAITLPTHSTGAYVAILDEMGRLHLALDDMQLIQSITPEDIKEKQELFHQAQAIFVDANLGQKTLSTVIALARDLNIPVAADPTSVTLAPRFTDHLADLWLVTPNEAEADALCPQPVPHAYAAASGSGHVPAIKTEILDPTGAGDALTAAVMFGLLNEIPLDQSVLLGLSAASLTLRTPGTVDPNLSLELLYDQLR